MKLSHSDKVTIGTGIATVAATALIGVAERRAPDSLAVSASVASLILFIRVAWSVPFDQLRARRLLAAARRNPSVPLTNVMFARRLFPNDEALLAEVRLRLQDIANAIDPAVVEPLFRVTQLRVEGSLVTWESSALAEFLKPLNGEQLDSLRNFLERAMVGIEREELRVLTLIDNDDGERKLAVDLESGDRIAVVDPRAHIFRMLESSGVALQKPPWTGPGGFIGNGTTGENADDVRLSRHMAQTLASLLR